MAAIDFLSDRTSGLPVHMTKKTFRHYILLAALSLLPACTHLPVASDVNHIVLLWLKPDVTAAKTEEIIQLTRQLAHIEGVEQLQVGRSIPSNRKIVDGSFDIGIYMRFDSRDDMNSYLNHPRHVALVNDHIRPNISKIVVYDF